MLRLLPRYGFAGSPGAGTIVAAPAAGDEALGIHRGLRSCAGWQQRIRAVAGAGLLAITAIACSTPPYEPLTGESDLAGAYVLAFQTACGSDCAAGKTVYLSANVNDPGLIATLAQSVPATVRVVVSPIEARDDLSGDEHAIVFTVEQAILTEGNVAVVRVGRSEVSEGVSNYRGADYQLSLRLNGAWLIRLPEDTGITVTTSVS